MQKHGREKLYFKMCHLNSIKYKYKKKLVIKKREEKKCVSCPLLHPPRFSMSLRLFLFCLNLSLYFCLGNFLSKLSLSSFALVSSFLSDPPAIQDIFIFQRLLPIIDHVTAVPTHREALSSAIVIRPIRAGHIKPRGRLPLHLISSRMFLPTVLRGIKSYE